jgi:uncharacterized membrane protein
MRHLQSVEWQGDNKLHWVAKGPAGAPISWDAEIVEDQPGKTIAWRSLDGSQVNTAGVVRFASAPGNRGTELDIRLTYEPPMGRLGAVVASLFGRSPEQEIKEDLRRWKQLMETGEFTRSDGPRGPCAR